MKCLEILRVAYAAMISFMLLINVTFGGPVPRNLPAREMGNQNHHIDSVNEVHHDSVDDIKQQELAVDALPDQDAVGIRPGEHQPQQQQPPDMGVPVAADDGAGMAVDSNSDTDNVNLKFELGKKMEKLPVEKLIPVDHLDVVKMEQDGHINKEYHKEMFLGGQHDEFKTETLDNAEIKLKEIVAKADLDQDGFLSKAEMEQWILRKMKEHFDAALKENDQIFKHLDPDGDGFIKWKEYYVHFLLSRDFDIESALKHIVDYDESIKLDQDDREALVSYKFRWTDADINPADNQLSKDEFMVFRHPEHSQQSLEAMVQNVMKGVDTNEDGVITEDEFSALPPGEVEGKEFEEMDRKWQEERKKEFGEIMDENHDGKVDKKELKNYLDPTNPIQAKLEADTLMSLMDDNRDEVLSMDEIMNHSDIFISSKLVNFAANVHDEF